MYNDNVTFLRYIFSDWHVVAFTPYFSLLMAVPRALSLTIRLDRATVRLVILARQALQIRHINTSDRI